MFAKLGGRSSPTPLPRGVTSVLYRNNKSANKGQQNPRWQQVDNSAIVQSSLNNLVNLPQVLSYLTPVMILSSDFVVLNLTTVLYYVINVMDVMDSSTK